MAKLRPSVYLFLWSLGLCYGLGIGPVDVTFHDDRIAGRSSGQGRFAHLSRPSGLDRLPVLSLGGRNYAPGTHDDTLLVPLMPGPTEWEIQPLPQSPIFRTWQREQWEGAYASSSSPCAMSLEGAPPRRATL